MIELVLWLLWVLLGAPWGLKGLQRSSKTVPRQAPRRSQDKLLVLVPLLLFLLLLLPYFPPLYLLLLLFLTWAMCQAHTWRLVCSDSITVPLAGLLWVDTKG